MMNLDNVTEKLKKEKKSLDLLMKKKNSYEEKIKVSENRIQKYESIINQHRFDEANSVLSASGLSLEDVMLAVKNGNLTDLQEKLTAKQAVG